MQKIKYIYFFFKENITSNSGTNILALLIESLSLSLSLQLGAKCLQGWIATVPFKVIASVYSRNSSPGCVSGYSWGNILLKEISLPFWMINKWVKFHCRIRDSVLISKDERWSLTEITIDDNQPTSIPTNWKLRYFTITMEKNENRSKIFSLVFIQSVLLVYIKLAFLLYFLFMMPKGAIFINHN